jgi:dihydroflavonol-4-reductase
MRAFVTGGTGFIGRHLIDHLLAHGYDVTALVRTFERARTLPRAVRSLPGDVLKPDTLRAGMRGADVVFHLAAVRAIGARASEPDRMRRTNVDATQQLIELAVELGVPRMVYTSDAQVLSAATPDESIYLQAKRQAHDDAARAFRQRGAPIISVCPGPVFGPGDASPLGRLLQAYVRRRLPLLFGAEYAQTWAYVADVAEAHRLAAEKGEPGQTYTFAGPRLSFREFFAACEQATGLPAPRLWLSLKLNGALIRILNRAVPAWAEGFRYLSGQPPLPDDQSGHVLGWSPRPIADGIQETIEWLKRHNTF